MHADLFQRAIVTPAPWDGVKVLEDAGPRRTWLERVPPGGSFVASAPGCLDLLVLDGELERRPTGWYVHEPAGRRFTSDAGCTVLAKLRPPCGAPPVSLDALRARRWPTQTPGLTQATLFDDHDVVAILDFAPGMTGTAHDHPDGEEFFVLAGELRDEQGAYRPHTWVRQPPRSVHAVTSPAGCLTFVFAHHLR